jgi:tRNA-specific 2-thiouridylase
MISNLLTKAAKPKVIVGLSGGVDSAVAALLLTQSGEYQVEAVFMKNWEEEENEQGYCPAEEDLKSAKQVAKLLEIPLHTANFSPEYWQHVFQDFLSEYKTGRTPNPDVLCNKEIKFSVFLAYAQKLGADFIATGHYAQIGYHPIPSQTQLCLALDQSKDQTYFLHQVKAEQLAKSIFPIGHLLKSDVRKMAETAGLPNHQRKDSTGICFIGERKFNQFLSEFLVAKPGTIETPEGEVLGEHHGLMYYTLGQRGGIQIGGKKNHAELPWYVVAKCLASNKLIIAQGQDHPWHFSSKVDLDAIHWIADNNINLTDYPLSAKIRYRQTSQACTLKQNNHGFSVEFSTPQRAATPGQYLVFYNEQGHCLGGGKIAHTNSLGGLKNL